MLEWPPFLLVVCVGRRLGGVLRVAASISLGRVRYSRLSFNMARVAGDVRLKSALLIVASANNRLAHDCKLLRAAECTRPYKVK